MNAGFDLPRTDDRRPILDWLAERRPDRTVVHAERMGWRRGLQAFLTPNGMLGATRTEVQLADVDPEYAARFASKGSLDDWKRHVATPAAASSRYIFLAASTLR